MTDSIHDEVPTDGSSFTLCGSSLETAVLKIYQTGELTVVGFSGRDVPEDFCIATCLKQLIEMIDRHKCKVMAFDLTGVKLVPSGMLGVLASVRKRVERVELYNPSPDMLEVLQITHFDRMFEIKDVAI